uniref:(northern house mosquito) hypothetical protein n=1 Tax=Culex pipiens TaxID=7175 RepID=A0A8D8PIF6_CULPI
MSPISSPINMASPIWDRSVPSKDIIYFTTATSGSGRSTEAKFTTTHSTPSRRCDGCSSSTRRFVKSATTPPSTRTLSGFRTHVRLPPAASGSTIGTRARTTSSPIRSSRSSGT